MPPKKKQSPNEVCCICCQAISSKDEVLFCAGRCQQQLHRYCASVSEHQYKVLLDKNTPFLCPSCYREQHEEDVEELNSTVEILRAELTQLKEMLYAFREHANSSTNAVPCCSKPTCSYAAAAAATGAATAATATVSEKLHLTAPRNNRPARQQPKAGWQTVLARRSNWVRRSNGNKLAASESQHLTTNRHNSSQPQREKVNVPGVRKVWGTMKACTTQTVATTIAQLCPTVAGKLQLRRKYKTSENGHVKRWWFLIRGEEEALEL